MKYFFGVFLVGLFICCLCQCSNEHQNQRLYRVEHYESGAIKSEGYYQFDSVVVDTFRTYWRNGKIKVVEVYNDSGALDGMTSHFDENGILRQTQQYSLGKLNGFIVDYFPNGIIKSKGWVQNGIFQGDVIEYYQNGLPKTYNFYDFEQNNALVFEYDSIKPKYISKIGSIFIIDTLLDKGDSLLFSLLIAHPPSTKNEIRVDELADSNVILNKQSITDSLPLLKFRVRKYPALSSIRFTLSQYDSILRKKMNYVYLYKSYY